MSWLARSLARRKVDTRSPATSVVDCSVCGRLPLYHMDLYRLSGPEEALGLGLEEYFDPNSITAVEWAERGEGVLPEGMLHIQIKADEHTGTRTFRIYREDEV